MRSPLSPTANISWRWETGPELPSLSTRSVSSHTSHSDIDYFCCGFLQNSSHFPEKPDNFTSCRPVSSQALLPSSFHRGLSLSALKYSLGVRQSNLLKGLYHFTMSTSPAPFVEIKIIKWPGVVQGLWLFICVFRYIYLQIVDMYQNKRTPPDQTPFTPNQ